MIRLPVIRLPVLVILVVACGGAGVAHGVDLPTMLRVAAPLILVAVGQTLVLAVGGIDLAVGAMADCAGAAMAQMAQAGLPPTTSVPLTLAAAAAAGLLPAFGILRLGLPPFAATLAMLAGLRGLFVLLGAGAPPVWVPEDPAPWVPASLLLALVVAMLAAWLLHGSRAGRMMLAIGNNPATARLAGVPVGWLQALAYALSAVLAALAGLLAGGGGWGLRSLAAALIGGGGMAGAMLGAGLVATLDAGAARFYLAPGWPLVVLGGLIVAGWCSRWRTDP